MSFYEYLEKVKGDCKYAVKIEWLNPDETVKFEFADDLHSSDISLNVNYQKGCRRTCSLTLNNDRNKFPVDFNNIWFGQKFKLWMGIYLDNETPYYLPQGVFYVSNPQEVYNPSTRTLTINGVDKWAYLDGTLSGKLSGTHQTNVDVNIYDAIRELLCTKGGYQTHEIDSTNIGAYFDIENSDGYNNEYYFKGEGGVFRTNVPKEPGTTSSGGQLNPCIVTTLTALRNCTVSFNYGYYIDSDTESFKIIINENKADKRELLFGVSTTDAPTKGSGTITPINISAGDSISFIYQKKKERFETYCQFKDFSIKTYIEPSYIDPIPPLLSPYFLTKTTMVDEAEKSVLDCPYTAVVERGGTYADVLLEYATILCADIYYDVHGRLVLEPLSDSLDNIADTDKEILWDYSVDEKTFLGLTQTYNFDKVYNDFIVLGNIANGYQFKGRVQNRNPMSNTSVQRIGLKTKEPTEDNQYVSDEQCVELAKYEAKIHTIMQKSGDIQSTALYHLDVNRLVTVSTPNNNMSKELFLITGFTLSSAPTMSIQVTSVNILKDFSVVEATVYE